MKIKLSGAVEVSIENGHVRAEGHLEYQHNKGELIVKGRGGSGGTAINNIFSNGSTVTMMGNGEVYINGVRVDKQKNKKDSKIIKMDIPLNGAKVSEVVCTGSSTLNIKDFYVLDERCTVALSGSSDLRVSNEKIKNLVLNASGSSDMKGALECSRLDANISGSSDLTGIFVSGSGSVNASGCSDAVIGCVSKKSIQKNVSSMSSVKLSHKRARTDVSSSDSSDDEEETSVPLLKKRKIEPERLQIEKKPMIPKDMHDFPALYELD